VLLARLANNEGETNVLFALRATTGSILWHYEMNGQYLMIASHGIVYIGTSDAHGNNSILRALRSADGKELWSYNTGQHSLTDPETALVVGDVLYLQSSVFGEPVINNTGFFQSLTALNATTGKVLWSKPLLTNVLTVPNNNQGLLLWDNNQVILHIGYHFCAYSSSDGSQLWCSHDFGQPPPNVSSNTVIGSVIPDSYAVAGQTLATIGISFGKTLQLKVETLSLKTGKVLWTRTLAVLIGSGGVGVGQIGALIRGDSSSVYAVIGDDTYAFHMSNGQILWHTRSGAAGITELAVG